MKNLLQEYNKENLLLEKKKASFVFYDEEGIVLGGGIIY